MIAAHNFISTFRCSCGSFFAVFTAFYPLKMRTRVDGPVVAVEAARHSELEHRLLQSIFQFGASLFKVVLSVGHVPGVVVDECQEVDLTVLALVFRIRNVKGVMTVPLPRVVSARRLETAAELRGCGAVFSAGPRWRRMVLCLSCPFSTSPASSSIVMIWGTVRSGTSFLSALAFSMISFAIARRFPAPVVNLYSGRRDRS